MLRMTGLILWSLVFVVTGLNSNTIENIYQDVEVKAGPTAEFPCPDPVGFGPCTCIADADYNMDADCSAAQNDAQLATAFTVQQAFCKFRKLTISPDTTTDLNTLTRDTFGCVGFEIIQINGTNLKVIEDGAFANSEDSLITLNLHNNVISDFPFETIPRFTKLQTLNLASNGIGTVQSLESDSLVTLNLNHNPALDISLGLFGRAPSLETLHLQNCGIDDLTPDMFITLDSIKKIDLSANYITQLRENAVNVPFTTLESLDFSDNPLYDIAVGAINIAGLKAATCELLFVNTEIVELCPITWEEYVNHLGEGSINLAGNPLRCGCDMAWLFDDLNLYQRLDSSTTCSDGYIVHELIPDVFQQHCDPMPGGICSVAAEQGLDNL